MLAEKRMRLLLRTEQPDVSFLERLTIQALRCDPLVGLLCVPLRALLNLVMLIVFAHKVIYL